ncbi:hypothetical protein [Alkalibacillus haloalkaliphilus]|uniref:Uncharacterized protein n=1 Tax=Alkalibacillus haloalkaliphilus TaxID=94136 RepID=A0A511W2U4_9BACI|nr:hypothetical protein [Alkalibacillus haloalkaliphilus]GEN45404.1 hypothetical protein AHA02nite_11800 [Alkalibacillus haloalkaliphilus]
MDTVNLLFIIFLVAIVVISFPLGLIVMKKRKDYKDGLSTVFLVSFVLLLFVFPWYQSAAAEHFAGTMGVILNLVLVFVLYIVYIIVSWLILMLIHRRSLAS